MQHVLGVATFFVLAWAVCGPSSGQRPAVPKDTLPAKLIVEPVPLGLDPDLRAPKENPFSDLRAQLGRRLFFDPVLSSDQTIACASCHDPAHGFASKDPVALGVQSKRGRRNAPSLFNRTYGTSFFWDGRDATLEVQALKPIEDPVEMNLPIEEALKRLQASDFYRAQFAAAFPEGLTRENLGMALANFQRTLLLGDSPVDRFRAGETASLNTSALHGLWLFESRGKCWKCHAGRNFTDELFHNTGVSWNKEPLDLGRMEVTKLESDRGRFKTPTLRGVAQSPPYMHDGSLATLEDVVEFYNRGGIKNPHLSPLVEPLGLSNEEVRDLVAFLKALSPLPKR